MSIDFLSLKGPFVLAFSGEGAASYLCDSAREVVDYLMSSEGGGYEIDGTEGQLLDWMNDDDNWSRDESGAPFWLSLEWGEITHAYVIAGVQSMRDLRQEWQNASH